MNVQAMRKPMVGFVLVLGLVAALALLITLLVRSLRSETGNLVDQVVHEALATERLHSAVEERTGALALFAVTGDNSALEEIGRGRTEFESALTDLHGVDHAPAVQQLLKEIDDEDDQLRVLVDQARSLVEAGRSSEATALYFQRIRPLRNRLLARIDLLRQQSGARLASAEWHYAVRGGRLDAVLWSALGVTIACVLAIALLYGTAASRLQRRLEHSVAVSEDRERTLRAVLSSTADLVFLVDRDQRIRYASFSSLRATGKTIEELSDKAIAELPMFGGVKELLERQLEAVLLEGGLKRAEGWCQHVSGRAYVELLLTPIMSGGRIDAAVVTGRDVTDRMEMVQDLRDSKRRIEGILESITDAFVSLDRDWRYSYVNREAERLLGMPRAALQGRSMWELFPGTVGTILDTTYHQVMESQQPAHLEEYIPAFGRWLELHAYPSYLGLSVYFRDISDRKRQEKRDRVLAETSAFVPESLDYDATVEWVAQMALPQVADSALLCVREDGGLRVEVRSTDPHVETRMRAIVAEYPPSATDDKGIAAELREGRAKLTTTVTDDTWIAMARTLEQLQQMRSLGFVSIISVPIRGHDEVLGVLQLGSLRPEVTFDEEDLHLAEQLASRAAMALENARLYQNAQRAIRQREDVLAVVSHDLRNPLNHVLLTTQHLLRKSEVGEGTSLKKSLLAIQRSTQTMRTLIQDLLDYAAIQAGSVTLERRPWPVQVLFREAWEAFEPLTRAHGLSLAISPVPESMLVHGDRQRILQVLSNLIGNAIKFSPEGGHIRVSAEEVANGTWIQFTVSDEGPGIPTEALPHIFERYWKGGTREREHGAGLGLSIVKGLVSAHGGRVWVESKPGDGSRFVFTFPAARPALRAVTEEKPPVH